MTSTRLPGKALADLGGRPVLDRVIARASRTAWVTETWVACTDRPADDPIARRCRDLGIEVFRGSEGDVLGRFVGAARASRADVVVRLTADCPLLDAGVIDRVVDELIRHRSEADYAANVLRRSFPRGLDVEAFWLDALLRADRFGTSAAAREHVTLPMRDGTAPRRFAVRSVVADRDDSDLRWTVDTAEDLAFARSLYAVLELDRRCPDYLEVVAWCRAHPAAARFDAPAATWDPARLGATPHPWEQDP
jgi:spore coat polysaccharide biosynthesis protein SpsF